MLATVSDKKFGTPVTGIPSQVSFYTADVKTAQDYYPFGMEMPGRQFNATTYVYSFNGKGEDKDAEYGWQDYEMREYDRRRAQFIRVDQYYKRYPFYSPYQFGGNNSIAAIDLNGLEPVGSLGNGGSGDFMYKSMIDRGRYQTAINGKQVDGTLFRVVDASSANFWVLKESKIVFYDDNIFGRRPIVNTEFFYFTKPPSKNISDYDGGKWEPYESENRLSMRQSNQVANGIGAGFAIGVTAPFAYEGLVAAEASGTFVGKGLASTGYNFISQLTTNGLSLKNINRTELFASFFIQGTGLKSSFARNALGNFFEFNGSGYHGAGSENFNLNNALLTTGIGTGLDITFSALKSLPIGNNAQMTRWQNLSYKPIYSNLLQTSQSNLGINNFFNSGLGQLTTGIIIEGSTNPIRNEDGKK